MPVILIAADMMENIRQLKNLLQDIGQVVFARDGVQTLEQARRHRPDIVLLDVMMDGYEICRRLKADAVTRDAPVIFISGADGERDEAAGLAAGAIDYILKPFVPAIVRGRVQNHLALVRATAELQDTNDALRKFAAAVDYSPAAVLITDRNARIEYVNAAFCDASGYNAQEALGQTPALLKSGQTPQPVYEKLWQTILHGDNWRGELRNRRKDGSLLWEDVAIAPVCDAAGVITHFVAINSDITQRIQMEEELRELATTDALTGVANRRRLMDLGTQELRRAQHSNAPFSVLMLDIDHFKNINDSLGHAAGDAVIRALARVCSESVRTVDTVGRFGGEEFALLLPMTPIAGALKLAERLRATVAAQELEWEGRLVRFTVSIGAAEGGAHSEDFAALLGSADQAMYQAKNSGRNRVAASNG